MAAKQIVFDQEARDAMKRGVGQRINAELNRHFGDPTTMSDYEHFRDVELLCEVTIF